MPHSPHANVTRSQWLTRLAFAAVVGPAFLAWILAIGEFCDWGRFHPWWRVEEFVRLDAVRDDIVSEVSPRDLPISGGDRIVSVLGKPYQKGLLARLYRESVPGDKVWVGVAPASGKPAFEVQVTLGSSSAPAVGIALVLFAGGLAFPLSALIMSRPLSSLLKISMAAVAMPIVWVTMLPFTGLFATLPPMIHSALARCAANSELAIPFFAGLFAWLTCKPGWMREIGVCAVLAMAGFQVAGILAAHGMESLRSTHDPAGALELSQFWFRMYAYFIPALGLLRAQIGGSDSTSKTRRPAELTS
ncbi:MAG: hypothetical protein U0Q16_16745 [Bryobacteraceae bacterium]